MIMPFHHRHRAPRLSTLAVLLLLAAVASYLHAPQPPTEQEEIFKNEGFKTGDLGCGHPSARGTTSTLNTTGRDLASPFLVTPSSSTAAGAPGALPQRKKASMLAVFARYGDEILWLTDPNTGVMDNSTGTPQFIMPIEIYQAADIAPDGSPIFPGLPPANASQNATGCSSSSNKLVVLPTWPAWARRWAFEKNITKEKVAPGTSQEAEFWAKRRLGIPEKPPTRANEWRAMETRLAIWGHKGKDIDIGRDDVELMHDAAATADAAEILDRPSAAAVKAEKLQQGLKIKQGLLNAQNVTAADLDKLYSGVNRSCVVEIDEISPALPLKIIPNRGAEAMAYLTAIIDHYDDLPDLMLYMHGHRLAWHTLLSQDWVLRRLAAINGPPDPTMAASGGYNALGCLERWRNDISQLFPTDIDANWWSNNGPRWHEALAARFVQAWREHLGEAYGSPGHPMPLPDYVRVPTAATFAASKEAILRRPKSFFVDLRNWMLHQTDIENKWLGIVMEFNVGIMIANSTHISSGQEKCLCELYAICSLPAEI